MNLFRILADMSHFASIVILLHTIRKTGSISGVSIKTQVLYALVFVTRYLNLFTRYISVYNTLMKLFFIVSSIYTVVELQKYKYKNPIAYQEMIMADAFKIQYLLIPCLVLAFVFNKGFGFIPLNHSFSMWLESVAVMPQLFMLSKSGKAPTLTTHYIFALGLYRALYIPNWIWRYCYEARFDKLAFFTGVIQTLVYSDFFYIYYKKVIKGLGFQLPH